MPERVQLSRQKGWRMPANTVKVDRSHKLFGNPYVHDDPAIAVRAYRDLLAGDFSQVEGLHLAPGQRGFGKERVTRILAEVKTLRGKNLACWCKPGAPCHADVLLEIANEPLPAAKDNRDGGK